MGTKRRLVRQREKIVLKKRVNELLGLLEMSKGEWKRVGLRVEGSGLEAKPSPKYFSIKDQAKWGRHKSGHKPSLKSQYSILWDLWQDRIENKKFLDELKEQIEQQEKVGDIKDD